MSWLEIFFRSESNQVNQRMLGFGSNCRHFYPTVRQLLILQKWVNRCMCFDLSKISHSARCRLRTELPPLVYFFSFFEPLNQSSSLGDDWPLFRSLLWASVCLTFLFLSIRSCLRRMTWKEGPNQLGTVSSELLSSYDKILKAKFLNKVLIEPLPLE